MNKIDVYLEIGLKRTFAGALDWPGWSRSARDESSALQALVDYGPRYARALRAASLGFSPPKDVSAFHVVERLKGDTTTDFGAPGKFPTRDADAVDEAELRRLQSILKACWAAFDAAVRSAKGKSLRTGPRGGGRDLKKIIAHVVEADEAYLGRLGWKNRGEEGIARTRDAILTGLAAAAHGEIHVEGPRGGKRWSPRYFVRRSAWHVLDHAWEIEDRLHPPR